MWNKIKCFEYREAERNVIFFKYDYKDAFSSFQIETTGNVTRKRKTKKYKTTIKDLQGYCLNKLYSAPQSVSTLKRRDLLKLCSSGLIPERYHSFYESLVPSAPTSDTLPEPDQANLVVLNHHL